MKGLKILVLMGLGVLAPTVARADLVWLEPWQVTTTPQASFWATPPFDSWEPGFLLAEHVNASAFVSVERSDDEPLDPSEGIFFDWDVQGVHFSRSFRITNAPEGDEVFLEAMLSGVVTRAGGTDVSTSAWIRIDGPDTSVEVGLSRTFPSMDGEGFSEFFFIPILNLNEGVYTLSGSLFAFAGTFGHNLAQARFDFDVIIHYIPEPSGFALIGLGLAGSVVAGVRLRKQAA